MTPARIDIVAKPTTKNFVHDRSQYILRLAEKGGKSRGILVRLVLKPFRLVEIPAAGITEGSLFRTANRKSRTPTKNAMTGIDI